MSRSLRIPYSTITPLFVLALTAACGHSSKTLDAYESSKKGVDPASTSGAPQLQQFACVNPVPQQFDAVNMRAYSVPPDVVEKVNATMAAMTPAQKARQMIGVPKVGRGDFQDIERSPDTEVSTIGTIRGYNYRDAGRGVNLDAGQKNNRQSDGKNFATVFPTSSLRAASWDVELERRVGEAIGDETAASKNNMLLAPCMNIIRHPQWGRTQETYSEDMYHTGRMAAAFTVGLQEHVVGCAKHFAANNIEDKRQSQNALMNEQTLREIYGRHFEMVVQDGGVGCIMASYNMINGTKSTQNKHLLRDILKAPIEEGGFGFEGLVLTDWWAMPGDKESGDSSVAQSVVHEALAAGTDIEVPWTLHYNEDTLAKEDQALVNDAARRVLTQKYLYNSATGEAWSKNPDKVTSTLTGASITTNMVHEDLAEEAALKSVVLLKNGASQPVLPLKSDVTSIAVLGPDQLWTQTTSTLPKSCFAEDGTPVGQGEVSEDLIQCIFHYATDPALGDRGSSRVNGDPARAVGPLQGLQEIGGAGRAITNPASVAEAANAQAIVVVVGYAPGDEGEEYYIEAGGDRASLDLPAGHNDYVNSVLALGRPTVIIVESGSITNLPWLNHTNQNQATIWAGYPGLRGGRALAKLIFGTDGANFSGKMPMAWPAPSAVPPFRAAGTETEMGYYFGYREYDRRRYIAMTPPEMVFPFGHGMSYSTFTYGTPTVPSTGPVSNCEIVNVSVNITNTSAVAGDEVALLFVKPPAKPAGITGDRPWKEVKGFARVNVPAGQTVPVTIPLRIRDLRRWEGGPTGAWVVDSGVYKIAVGKDADDAENPANEVELTVNGN